MARTEFYIFAEREKRLSERKFRVTHPHLNVGKLKRGKVGRGLSEQWTAVVSSVSTLSANYLDQH
jgi:hypothetical protein